MSERRAGASSPSSSPRAQRHFLVDSADLCVEIPMVRRGASLNLAVAGSLVLYRLAGLA